MSVVIASLLITACHHGGSEINPGSYPGPDPLASVTGPPLEFERHALTGFSGAVAIAYPTPPYVIGTSNDGKGNLTVLDLAQIGLGSIYESPHAEYGMATADFNGDGVPDVLAAVYSPTNVDSYGYLYLGTAPAATGGPNLFSQDLDFGTGYVNPAGFSGYRGRTETVVVADFNNDGAVDIFLPTYTYLDSTYDLSGDPRFVAGGAPPNVYNAYQSFLLLNDGTGHFTEHAVQAGVSMHSLISGLQPASTDPNGLQPEGVQAVDFNMDGLIDLYAGGHLFINQGVDENGVPHFKDMAPTWGLTQALLDGPPPWASGDTLPGNYLVNDEGAKFLDWNNDGHLDLLIFRFSWGPAHGPRLFEFDGSRFIERINALETATATCKKPVKQTTSFFWSSKPFTTNSLAAGINAYDLDNDGLEDVLVSGDSTGATVFRNYGCGFREDTQNVISGVPGGGGAMALADFDGDGRIDVVYPEALTHEYFINRTKTAALSSFTVEVLGPNGEHNQFGRVIQVFPPGTTQIFTRVVDGGSGYLAQNQYPILVGTPFAGAHTVKVYYAPLTKCSYGGPPCKASVLKFSISPGQRAYTYAPSPTNPSGTVTIVPGP